MAKELNELQQILKRIQFATDKSIEEIAKEIDYSRPYLNNEVNKGVNEDVKNKLLEYEKNIEANNGPDAVAYHEGKISIIQAKNTNETLDKKGRKAKGGKSGLQVSISTETLLKLATANELLAKSHFNFSESNRTLAENNKELIQMMKTNSNVASEKPPFELPNIADFLEVLAEVASGEMQYRSKHEAAAALHKRFFAPPKKVF